MMATTTEAVPTRRGSQPQCGGGEPLMFGGGTAGPSAGGTGGGFAGGTPSAGYSSNNYSNSSKIFINTVSKIVNRVAMEEGHESPVKRQRLNDGTGNMVAPSAGGGGVARGPLTHQEIAELNFLCTLGSTLNGGGASAAAADDDGVFLPGTTTPQQQQLLLQQRQLHQAQLLGSGSYNHVAGGAAAATVTATPAAGVAAGDDESASASSAPASLLRGFAAVEGDELAELITLLDRHVSIAAGVRLIQDAMKVLKRDENSSSTRKASLALDQWLQGEGAQKCHSLKVGLEAASIIIFIVSTPGIDRRAVNEDAIEASITLMRLHLLKNLVPALNQTGHLLGVKVDDQKAVNASPSKRRRRSSIEGTSASAKELKKVYKLVLSNVTQHLLLSERLDKLIQSIALDDPQVLMVTGAALHALEVDCTAGTTSAIYAREHPPAQQLQLLCISLVTTAFRTYPDLRESILEDLFPVMLKLPSGKRSLRAYGVRYSSVPTPESFSTWNADLVGGLLSNSTEPHYIQMMTLLVLSMVQASVARPVYECTVAEGGQDQTQQLQQQPPADEAYHGQEHKFQLTTSGLEVCRAVSDFFCTRLLKRCAEKGRAVEFRPILNNLVEDLLLVFTLPEYPGAEFLLLSLANQLRLDVIPASAKLMKGLCNSMSASSPASPAPETCYLNTAFDLLAKICSVQARVRAAHLAKPLLPTVNMPQTKTTCFCNAEEKPTWLICCNRCKSRFHMSCVGVVVGNVPDEWYCDGCRLAHIVERDGLKHECDGEKPYVDELYALHHAYLSMLSHRAESHPELKDAAQFQLARWIQQLAGQKLSGSPDATILQQPKRIIGDLLCYWNQPGPGCEPLTEAGTTRLVLSVLAASSRLLNSFQQQIGFFVTMMEDVSMQSLRKLSLKAIEKIVEGDSGLMQLPFITKAVSKRLKDQSISVREAAVSLVGSYVVQSPAVASCFQASLLGCLRDPGVSVRKRAVRIFQEILLSNPGYKGHSVVCGAMLKQAADPKEEDSVRDLIHELFVKLWLENGDALVPYSPKKPAPSDGAAGPNSSGRKGKEKSRPDAQKRVEVAAEQMMEVVRASGSNEHLETLLTKLLHGTTDADKGRKKVERRKWEGLARKHCDQIVSSLFELLISIEEQRADRPLIGMDIAATLQTIAIFSELSPDTVLENAHSLLPYLKADNSVRPEDEQRIVGAACDIIYRLANVRGEKTSEQIGTSLVAEDLVQITYKFHAKVLESAVRALSSIALGQEAAGEEDSLFYRKILGLVRTFYDFLYRKNTVDDFSSQKPVVASKVDRALTVLGLICQYNGDKLGSFSWEEEVQREEQLLIPTKQLDWSNCCLACYRVFTKYLFKVDVPTKCSAIRAFSGLFASHPRLMLLLEQIGLIEELMSPESDAEVQLESLKCWQRILVSEEKRVDGGKAKARMDSDRNITTAKRISGDQDSDATLFGAVLTNHASRILEMTQQLGDEGIRFASLVVLGSLLRQGQVNPNEATPYLFALQGDIGETGIRRRALQLLMTEGEKRPDILRQRVCAGVKRAYDFQRSIYPGKVEVSALVEVRNGSPECVFASVYKECIASNRKQRQGLFNSLLGLFELDDADDLKPAVRVSPRSRKRGDESAVPVDLGLLSFVSQILAHLPYSSASDPLYIIHTINSMVNLQGSQILEQFAALLRPVGLSSSDEYDETNWEEDALERAAREKFPTRTHEAKELSTGTFDTKAFEKLCCDGTALVLLLRLKNHLKQLYHISDARILEYDPNSKDRSSDKNLMKADMTKPFDGSISFGDRKGSAGTASLDSLIRQYAEFRRLMREAMMASVSSEAKIDDGENESNSGDDEEMAEED